jgi:putative flippase GtrA
MNSTLALSFRHKAMRFLAVGGTGFCVDAGLLYLLVANDVSSYRARALSLFASITLTWLLNRRFSFGPSEKSRKSEYGRYGVVALIAASVNYAVYAYCAPLMTPLPAMVAGSVAAICLTFTGYDRWVFAQK